MLCLTLNASACKPSKQNVPATESNFDVKAATNLIDTYMKYLSMEDYESAKRLYTSDLLKSTQNFNTDLKIKGYSTQEISEVGKAGHFKLKVVKVNLSIPVTSVDEYTIKVVKDGPDYKIDDIGALTDIESFADDGQLRLRSKSNVKTNLIIDMDGVPQYAYSKDDKANLYKLPIPKSSFGVMAFSYDGNTLAASTHDKDVFLFAVKIDESMSVQGGGGGDSSGGGGGGGGAGGGGQGQGGGAGGSSIMTREKPIGKEVSSLDLLKDSNLEFMTFSLDQKYILAQYNKSSMGRCIRLYSSESSEMIPIKFEDNYPVDKVDVVFSSFDKDVLNYEVIVRDTTDKSLGDLAGKWQLDLKGFKIKKL